MALSAHLEGASRASKELDAARRSKEIEELARVARQLSQADKDSLDLTSKLSSLLVSLLKTVQREGDTTEDLDLMLKRLHLPGLLNPDQQQDFEKAINVIFSSSLHRELFFRPVQSLGFGDIPLSNSVIHPNLMLLFNEIQMEMDQLSASCLVIVRDLICCDSLLSTLSVTDFYTLKYLLDLDESNRPELSPIRLQQIDEGNVNDCANFLANHADISSFTLIRYLIHLAKLDTECALLVAQSNTLTLTPHCLLFFVFCHQESLIRVASLDGGLLCSNLGESVHQSIANLLVRALTNHLPGWPTAWQDIFNRFPNLLGLVLDAFKTNNEAYLGRKTNLVGAHRSPEGLEVAPLGDFLLRYTKADTHEGEVEWCRTSMYLPGMVRALLASPHLAHRHLPFLVELGDVQLLEELGLLRKENARVLVEHLVNTYKSGDCPIAWEHLVDYLLANNGPRECWKMLLTAAPSLKPGILSRR